MQPFIKNFKRLLKARTNHLYNTYLFTGMVFIFYITSIGICESQVFFISESVKNCYNKLPDICKIDIQNQLKENPASTKFQVLCKINSTSFPLNIINSINGITHIGCSIFSDSISGFYPNEIYRFLERLFLESELYDKKSFIKYLSEANILIKSRMFNNESYNYSLRNFINYCLPTTSFILRYDGMKYFATWNDGIRQFLIVFPAKNTLMTGLDKKELDELLFNNLINLKAKEPTILTANFDVGKNYKKIIKNIFVILGQSYFENISYRLYVSESLDSSCNILFDQNYYAESFSNLLLEPELIDKVVTVFVRQKQYGNIIKNLTIDYTMLWNYFTNCNYEAFVGFENRDSNDLIVSVVFFNKFLNNLHLLYIKTNRDTLFANNLKLEATLYTNIPTDNIKNIFSDYYEIKKELQYELKLK